MKTMAAINALPYEQAARAMAAFRATVLDGLHAVVQCNGPLPVEANEATQVICVGAQMEYALIGQGIAPEVTLLPPA
ncbi:MAG: hypothetical protein WAT09_15915 [Paracoccaceae bacterium]